MQITKKDFNIALAFFFLMGFYAGCMFFNTLYKRYSIDGLKLIKTEDWINNDFLIESVILSLKDGNADILQLKKNN